MKRKAAVFLLGAVGYSCMELIARGRTHWSMALLGGTCLLGLVKIYKRFEGLSVAMLALIGTIFITISEFFAGVIVNLWLNWRVWDYSGRFGNLLGQICPLFSGLWFLLCLAVFPGIKHVSDYMEKRRRR
ncbi:MAG: hypothetical protein ACI3VB_04110 [Oscillospiraceae bacterium]